MTVSIFKICSKVLGVRAEYPLANFDLEKLARLHKRISGSRGTHGVHMCRYEGTLPRATTSAFAEWNSPNARRCAQDISALRDRISLLLIGKCLDFQSSTQSLWRNRRRNLHKTKWVGLKLDQEREEEVSRLHTLKNLGSWLNPVSFTHHNYESWANF